MSASEAVTTSIFLEHVQEQTTAQIRLIANELPKKHFDPIYSICHPSGTSQSCFQNLSKAVWLFTAQSDAKRFRDRFTFYSSEEKS